MLRLYEAPARAMQHMQPAELLADEDPADATTDGTELPLQASTDGSATDPAPDRGVAKPNPFATAAASTIHLDQQCEQL